MGLLILLQVALDLGFIAIVTLLLIERSKARTAEDPRLSRGLQLLTSKIAVLQDLMDRSETASRQMTQILERKQQDVQEIIEEVESHLHKVSKSIEKSQEVAKIFQDRIPHQEIIERQTTVKYIQAAKLAHQGVGIDDISRQVDIPRGELELIIKLNRDRLLVRDEPAWAQSLTQDFDEKPTAKTPAQEANEKRQASSDAVASDIAPLAAEARLAAEQRMAEFEARAAAQAVLQTAAPTPVPAASAVISQPAAASTKSAATPRSAPAPQPAKNTLRGGSKTVMTAAEASSDTTIRPVIFKRISVLDDLS
jgi:hypothetical protein